MSPAKLLTLTELARRAEVSMSTATRYKSKYKDRIPSEGTGRKQRYPLAAVREMKKLRSELLAKYPGRGRRKAASGGDSSLLTMASISQQTGISTQTLRRYVKAHGERIPHEGEGRARRYHPEAVAVFRELRARSKTGRKPKSAAAGTPVREKEKVEAAASEPKAAPELLTLTAISRQTGISDPTLRRYFRAHTDRIPHEGEGLKRRYHPEAVAIFRELRAETANRRKSKAEPATPTSGKRKAKAAQPAATSPSVRKKRSVRAAASETKAAPELLTLTAVSRQTGISDQTLRRYVKAHGDRIPYEGEGRARRYRPEAVAVFRELRARTAGGRKPKAEAAAPARGKRKAKAARVGARVPQDVEARLTALETQVALVLRKLDEPIIIKLQR